MESTTPAQLKHAAWDPRVETEAHQDTWPAPPQLPCAKKVSQACGGTRCQQAQPHAQVQLRHLDSATSEPCQLLCRVMQTGTTHTGHSSMSAPGMHTRGTLHTQHGACHCPSFGSSGFQEAGVLLRVSHAGAPSASLVPQASNGPCLSLHSCGDIVTLAQDRKEVSRAWSLEARTQTLVTR